MAYHFFVINQPHAKLRTFEFGLVLQEARLLYYNPMDDFLPLIDWASARRIGKRRNTSHFAEENR